MPGLEPFIDGVVASLSSQHIAGAQVAIVKDGRALLVKGYGLAALKPERAADPEHSLFRLASITKTFTWLVVTLSIVGNAKRRCGTHSRSSSCWG